MVINGNLIIVLFIKLSWPGDSKGYFLAVFKLPPTNLSAAHGGEGGFVESFHC